MILFIILYLQTREATTYARYNFFQTHIVAELLCRLTYDINLIILGGIEAAQLNSSVYSLKNCKQIFLFKTEASHVPCGELESVTDTIFI